MLAPNPSGTVGRSSRRPTIARGCTASSKEGAFVPSVSPNLSSTADTAGRRRGDAGAFAGIDLVRPGAAGVAHRVDKARKLLPLPRRPGRGRGTGHLHPCGGRGLLRGLGSVGSMGSGIRLAASTRQVATQAQRRFRTLSIVDALRAPACAPSSAFRRRLMPAPAPLGPTPPSCSATSSSDARCEQHPSTPEVA